MNRATVLKRFRELTVWRSGDQRAPHKPLLVLLALGRLVRGESRLAGFRSIDEPLRRLLREFGPSRQAYHSEYPFWRLRSDGIWEVPGGETLAVRESNTDPKKSELLRENTEGGFTPDVHAAFVADGGLVREVANQLLAAHFPTSVHQDVLAAVGLEVAFEAVHEAVERLARNPEFRMRILRAYEGRCAVCGLDLRLDGAAVAIEAAHIQWHCAGGPDRESNGLALCTLHHKTFDRGAFTLDNGRVLRLSECVVGTSGFEEWLARFHGERIRSPLRDEYGPDPRFLAWHREQVFRGPARAPKRSA